MVERSSTIRCSRMQILFPSFAITSSAPIAFVISLQVAMQFSWSGFHCRKKKTVSFTRTYSSSSADNGEPIPRIVNIPVDFTNADKEEVVKCTVTPDALSQHKAAVLVQAWCRGYLVRKTDPLVQLREIHEVTSKLRELQSDLSDVDFIKRALQNPKTRVWLTESVMDLLFRLDAVQGAHEFVREIRKAISREVVDCQDCIDALFLIDYSL